MAPQQEEEQKYHPLPSPGDIVWCQFPQNIGEPGPKPRPALVIRTATETHEVAVVYGTSQKTDRVYPTEFVMDPNDPGFAISGLSFKTKFDMRRMVQLPFNNTWFSNAPGLSQGPSTPLPKLGVLHPSYMTELLKAAREAGF